MRKIASLLVFLAMAGCASTADMDTSDNATAGIRAATEAWRAAYDSRDAGRITAMYEKSAVLWGTTSKTIAASPEAIADYFKDAALRPNARVVFTEQNVRVLGDVAFDSGLYTFKDIRDGREISNPARYSMVFQRKQGNWMLVHHHSSRLP